MKRTALHGFTLVELAIVLVIIGLIVGGVLVGQSLIRQAELRSFASDLDKYKAVHYAFRDKYGSIPGDMPNAYNHFNGNGCTNDITVNGCNGNGNGIIDYYSSAYLETYKYWMHTSAAGMVAGTYSGVGAGGGGHQGIIGINVPGAKAAKAGYHVFNYNLYTYIGWEATKTVNYLFAGGEHENEPPITSIVTPLEAYSLDIKLDEGQPANGKFVGGKGFESVVNNCTVGSGASATYAISNDTKSCFFAYVLD